MAKGKHAAALFEVIARSRPMSRQSRPGFFQRIFGWFKSSKSPAAPAPAYRTSAADPANIVAALVNAPPPPSSASPVAADPPGSSAPGQVAPPSNQGLAFDPERREVALRLSYFSAAVGGLALVTALALAFLIGHKAANRPPQSPTATPAVAQREPVNPEVLRPQQRRETPGAQDRQDRPPTGAGQGAAARGPVIQGPTTQPIRSRERVVGRNYIIMQSYPDARTANDIAKMLTENGVECTVQKVPDWTLAHPDWLCVVGTDGYTTITNNRDYQNQIKKIKDISNKNTSRGSFKALDPMPKKWIAADALASGQ